MQTETKEVLHYAEALGYLKQAALTACHPERHAMKPEMAMVLLRAAVSRLDAAELTCDYNRAANAARTKVSA